MPTNDPYQRMIEAARRRSEASDLVSIKALAAELNRSLRTLRRWNNRPDAPWRVKLGREHFYRRADVKRWLEQGTSGAQVKARDDGESL